MADRVNRLHGRYGLHGEGDSNGDDADETDADNGVEGRLSVQPRDPPRVAPQTDPVPPPGGVGWGTWYSSLRHAISRVRAGLIDWMRRETYVPAWLPESLRRMSTGYVAAIVGQIVAALVTLQLIDHLPAFALQSALAYLVVVCAAIIFGAGPGVVATLVAAALLEYVVLPPHFVWDLDLDHLVNVLLYLLVGISTVVLITRMLRAVRIANAATQRMEDLLSITGHELRTPLAGIKTSVQLAERRARTLHHRALSGDAPSLDPHALEDVLVPLATADRQVERLNELITDLLDTSRIRTGTFRLEPRRCDLGEIVREVVEEQRAQHPDRTIALEVPQGEPVPVVADPLRIAQVLSNYLTNALKYSKADQPVVVGLARVGEQVRVWVRDHGPGLPEEEHGRVWEMFHRAPGVEVQNGPRVSLGLGLPISRAIVERHGGEVGLRSAPGRGSTFSFTLPLAR
jgi:signal transduction histidine kinase